MQQQRKATAAPATLEDFIMRRDYTGARAFLEVDTDLITSKI